MSLLVIRSMLPRGIETARRATTDSSSLLFAAQLCSAGAAFVANILAARGLGPAGRGELALLLQVAYFGSIGVVLGSDRSVVAIYAGESARKTTMVFTRLLRLPSVLTAVGAVVIAVAPTSMPDAWRIRFCLAALFMVTNSFIRAARSVAITAGKARHYLFGVEIPSDLLQIIGLAWLSAIHNPSSAAWMSVYLIAGTLPAATWFGWWQRRSSPKTEKRDQPSGQPDDQPRCAQARREGLQLVPAAIARSGTLRVDRLVLAALATTTALGLYASVATLTELIAWPLMAYADSRLGLWRKAYDAGNLSLRKLVTIASVYSIVAAGATSIIIRWLLVPAFGESYAAALPLVVPLVAAAAILGVSQMLITALTAIRQGPLSSVVESITLIVSLIAYFLLIHAHGAIGAAYGSLIGYSSCLLLAGACLAYLRRRSQHVSPAYRPGTAL